MSMAVILSAQSVKRNAFMKLKRFIHEPGRAQ